MVRSSIPRLGTGGADAPMRARAGPRFRISLSQIRFHRWGMAHRTSHRGKKSPALDVAGTCADHQVRLPVRLESPGLHSFEASSGSLPRQFDFGLWVAATGRAGLPLRFPGFGLPPTTSLGAPTYLPFARHPSLLLPPNTYKDTRPLVLCQ